ncbi:IS66 family transposase [Komagataeibacter europaeus]|uniref:IS66 family transposase n=1 Tax=Komagataeibacter europaeus TaxID=33995 RepID=UPI0038CF7496
MPSARPEPAPWLLSAILTGRFADHWPLYRQSMAVARAGIDFDTSTLVGRCLLISGCESPPLLTPSP